MPELPEIENLAQELARTIVGRTIVDARVGQPKAVNLPPAVYAGKVRGPVLNVRRRAKYAVVFLPKGCLWLHLGMGGKVVLDSEDRGEKAVVAFRFADGGALRVEHVFMGQAHYLEGADCEKRWQRFGVEPLSDEFTLARLQRLAESRPRWPLKAILTEQEEIAGIGNAYADEILFQARLHPGRLASSLSAQEWEAVRQATVEVLSLAVREGGETGYTGLSGQPGRYHTRVHGQQTCPRCGASLEKTTLRGRATYSCPRCQPAP